MRYWQRFDIWINATRRRQLLVSAAGFLIFAAVGVAMIVWDGGVGAQ